MLIFLFLFLLVSCTEENLTESLFSQYNGTWLWLKTEGGLFPRVFTPENGVTIKVVFDNLNNFKIYRNDSLKVLANYKIEKSEYDRDKITYSNITTYNYHYTTVADYAKIYSDTLEIWDGSFDGYFSFYKKIN